MASPSIIPNDRLDKDFYLVLQDFRNGAAFRETEGIDYPTLIQDLLSGQYDNVLRIVAFNPVEGWSRDASEDTADALADRAARESRDLLPALEAFVQAYSSRPFGIQLALPLPEAA